VIFGASLASFRGLTLSRALDFYSSLSREFNLGAVEVYLEKREGRPSLWAEDIRGEVRDKLAHFVQQFEVAGAHLPFIGLNPVAANPRLRQESLNQLKTGIETASQLGMKYVVWHAAGDNPSADPGQRTSRLTEVIAELTDWSQSHSMVLTIENTDPALDLKYLATLVRQINSKNLKITLDVGHAHMRSVPPLLTYPIKEVALRILDTLPVPFWLKQSMPYQEYGSLGGFLAVESDLIFCLHLHDYNGKRDHLRLGEGKIDFSFLANLNKKGFSGPLILETEFIDHYGDFKSNYQRLQKLIHGG